MANTTPQRIPTNLLPELVEIEGGTFEMGSNEHGRESPIHTVQIPTFHMGKYLITNAQYVLFLNAYGSIAVKPDSNERQKMIDEHHWGVQSFEEHWKVVEGFKNHPVINVSWYGAVTYCQWLSKQTGERYRLPSEAEWEYAAKDGKYQQNFQYSGSNHLDEVGWYRRNSHRQTKPVGLKYPNQLGLHDMSGNVDEWCTDHWHENYKGAPKDGSAWIKEGHNTQRVVRGGSWGYGDLICRVSDRSWKVANSGNHYIGFRVSRN